MPVHTDVQDLAEAHVRAASLPEASGSRFIICAGQVASREISDMLRAEIPELEKRTPRGTPGGGCAAGGAVCL
jgi:nucleoside-diphosphate-sugar epimerase